MSGSEIPISRQMIGSRDTTSRQVTTKSSSGQNFLTVMAIAGIVIVSLALLFVVQSLIAPRLLVGTLSEAIPQPCNNGQQWVLYDCKRNPLTRLGCIVPGSQGRFLTEKTIAVHNTTCLPDSRGQVAGERVISNQWQLLSLGECISEGLTCCNYDGTCTRTAKYTCERTTQPAGGENQCRPSFLPAPFPAFDPRATYDDTNPAVIQVPCRENFCGTRR